MAFLRKSAASALAATLALTTLWAVTETPASAQDSDSAAVSASVSALSPWVGENSALKIGVRVKNTGEAPVEIAVRARLMTPITSRLELSSALDDGSRSTFREFELSEPRKLAVGPTQSIAFGRTWTELGKPRLGVYPIEIEVTADDETISLTRSAIPFIVGLPAQRLRATVIFRVHIEAPFATGGIYSPDIFEALSLQTTMASLQAIPPGTASIALTGSTLDLLSDLSDGFQTLGEDGEAVDNDASSPTALQAAKLLQTLRLLGATSDPVLTPYAESDLSSLNAIEAPAERLFTASKVRLSDALSQQHGSVVDLIGTSALDASVVAALPDQAQTLLVTDSAIASKTGESYSPDLFGTSTPLKADKWRVLVADEHLSELADSGRASVAQAQTMIAETAIRWLELPLFSPKRLIVVAPTSLPKPALVRPLMSRVSSAPWLRLLRAEQIEDTDGEVIIAAAPETEDLLPSQTKTALSAFNTATKVIRWGPGELGADLVSSWRRGVLTALAQGLDGSELAKQAGDDIREHLGKVRPIAGRRITFTSRTGTVPVVLVNDNPFPMNVGVQFTGRRIRFPEGARQDLTLEPGDTTVEVPVEVLGQGRFSLRVAIVAQGRRLSDATIELRSTQVSSVALVIVVLGILYLIVQGVRRKRSERLKPTETEIPS